MQPSILEFIRSQRAAVPTVTTADLTGKTVLVIGANTGIGYQAAKHFADMNGKVVIACRSKERGEAAVTKLKEETGRTTGIELRLVDLAKFSSVSEFCSSFAKEEERLDVLVANAGIVNNDYSETDDGWESTIQVNNLSALLSCILLAPLMNETAQKIPGSHPRIVVVGSGMHYFSKFEQFLLDEVNPLKTLGSKEYSKTGMTKRYQESKLISLFIARSLQDLLKHTPVVVNCVDPGFCLSEIRRNIGGVQLLLSKIMEWFMAWTAEQGSRQLVWAALAKADDIQAMKGAYVCYTKITEPSDYSISKEGLSAQGKIWANMIEELSRVDSKVSDIIKEFEQER
ncbi:retinol dehydrogenase 12 [Coprinopsis marcescibilis]|uniref:Retinol dehydrogenase 12 n=1 Tax=Coprinopsis marcescibilis TaxID=230819 RepID=A0A5C3KS30_COPMA|nr:retinol dehydrogenase 12 [Coprinopsis marcescibilis]